MRKSILFFAGLSLLLFSFGSCKKQDQQSTIDHQVIEDYVKANNLQGNYTSSGLYYVITKPGNNSHPTVSSRVTVDYKGYFLDGTVFDQGTNVSFKLYNVIQGWQEGIPLIGAGGQIILIIPSGLAYGSSGSGSIPPNTVLRFDVSLHGFSN
jgi:FKBP-type peptidyl-prolyl cis-trans isomerase FkpA